MILLEYLATALSQVDRSTLANMADCVQRAKRDGNTIFFVGNGGSAAIASHMAADWMKNGKFRAMCFSDAALLTCLGNDRGFGGVFSEPILMHGRARDVLVAISSSGQSVNILNAVHAARSRHMQVVTLSGMQPDNPLSSMGNINFHVPSNRYGVIELTHEAILHTILDAVMDEQAT